MLKKSIVQGFKILKNPEKEFKDLQSRKFETVLGEYVTLLIASGVLTALISFLFGLGKGYYLDVFFTIDVQYGRMINYASGRSTSLLFFYLFAGSFIMFFISLLLRIFLRKLKYTQLLALLFYAFMPLLLFSWIPVLPLSLLIWTIFLFVIGVRQTSQYKIKKDSILQRD